MLCGTILAALGAASAPAFAQGFSRAETEGLDVIVVTAQKREQSLQDVPIAVSAIGGDAIEANRITDVSNLTGMAPGVTIRTSAGGSKLPAFQIRGANSFGVVPGSDKQVSIYVDGVYISSPRGSIFDLPDTERIEILRGPQGTLFGRNATAGAISVYTRDPAGEAGFTGTITVGNRDKLRGRVSVDLPQMGPFSGYFSYVHDEKRGDIRNLGAGQVWDRTNAVRGFAKAVETSPEWLGNKNSESFFAAVKFEPSDTFKTVYKFDYTRSTESPEATAAVGYEKSIPLLSSFLTAMIDSQAANGYPAVPFVPSGTRPKAVLNSWAIPTNQKVYGHSLTSTLDIGDITLKNIAAYRFTALMSSSSIDGMSALFFTPETVVPYATFIAFARGFLNGTEPPAVQGQVIGGIAQGLGPLVGQPFAGIATAAQNRGKQWSDELQLNYDTDEVTITAGLLWFHSKDWTAEHLLQNTVSFAPIPGGVIQNANIGLAYNKATSMAGYGQFEFHATDKLDLVAGIRITNDKKSGSFTFGPNLDNLQVISFKYRKTKPSFLAGVNYKPTEDTLLFAKFSTAYVSGGSTAGIDYVPETAESYEAGIKTELLNRRLRMNLAVYHVIYRHLQTPQSATGANFADLVTQITGDPTRAASIGTFIFDQGGRVKADGFEFEFQAAPVRNLNIGGNLSYYKTKFINVDPRLKRTYLAGPGDTVGDYVPTQRPAWTGAIYGQYDTEPLFGDAFVSFRIDANWQSSTNYAQNPAQPVYSGYGAGIKSEGSYWLVNGRVALREVDFGGVKAELAAWGKNLFDEKRKNFVLNIAEIFASANYIPARSYGLDFTVRY